MTKMQILLKKKKLGSFIKQMEHETGGLTTPNRSPFFQLKEVSLSTKTSNSNSLLSFTAESSGLGLKNPIATRMIQDF